jgi:3-hydroxyacyl-CoA dehydrogenase/enoyl-CoA hydratase/3-hydroxybutyryl-CoA epimerase
MNEAANLLLEGEPVEALDKALVKFGFPVGPITLLDEVGIDVGAKISPILLNELGERFTAPAAFDRLLADGRKGRKAEKGFYLYGAKAKGKKQVDASVYNVLSLNPVAKLSGDQIALRCVVQMLNEAVRCLEEGIISSARDGDIGAIFGIGFPPFLGGPFRYIDQMGAATLVAHLRSFESRFGARFAPSKLLLEKAETNSTFY